MLFIDLRRVICDVRLQYYFEDLHDVRLLIFLSPCDEVLQSIETDFVNLFEVDLTVPWLLARFANGSCLEKRSYSYYHHSFYSR